MGATARPCRVRQLTAAGDGFGDQDLKVVVKASDANAQRQAAEQVRRTVAGLDGVTDVTSDLSRSVPRISVRATDKAAAGFTDQTLGTAVAQSVKGTTAAKATLDDTERNVVVRSAEPAETLAQLKELRPRPGEAGRHRDRQAGRRSGLDDPDRRSARGDHHRQADRRQHRRGEHQAPVEDQGNAGTRAGLTAVLATRGISALSEVPLLGVSTFRITRSGGETVTRAV